MIGPEPDNPALYTIDRQNNHLAVCPIKYRLGSHVSRLHNDWGGRGTWIPALACDLVYPTAESAEMIKVTTSK